MEFKRNAIIESQRSSVLIGKIISNATMREGGGRTANIADFLTHFDERMKRNISAMKNFAGYSHYLQDRVTMYMNLYQQYDDSLASINVSRESRQDLVPFFIAADPRFRVFGYSFVDYFFNYALSKYLQFVKIEGEEFGGMLRMLTDEYHISSKPLQQMIDYMKEHFAVQGKASGIPKDIHPTEAWIWFSVYGPVSDAFKGPSK